MKQMTLWGLGLALAGVVLWLGFQGVGDASHRPASSGFNKAFIAEPEDEVSDEIPEHPGSGRNIDRLPDRPTGGATAADPGDLNPDSSSDKSTNMDGNSAGGDASGVPDRTGQRDSGTDLVPDCGDGPGDSECGNSKFSGDDRSDRRDPFQYHGEGISDEVPDYPIVPGFNRTMDGVTDRLPDHPIRDETQMLTGMITVWNNDRVGARDCASNDVVLGECDRNFGNHAEAGGNTGDAGGITEKDRPPSVMGGRPNADNAPDATPDDNAASSGIPDRTGNGRGTCDTTAGECDRVRFISEADSPFRIGLDSSPDRLGGDDTPSGIRDRGVNRDGRLSADGTQDGVPDFDLTGFPFIDNRPDNIQDRGNLQDRGRKNHSAPSRDAYSFGPGDKINDNHYADDGTSGGSFDGAADRGGLTYGDPFGVGGGGGGGCSLVAAGNTTGSGLAYLLILLAPVAVVVVARRRFRR